MHPKPEEEDTNLILSDRSPNKNANNAGSTKQEGNVESSNHVTSGNLIQLDGWVFNVCICVQHTCPPTRARLDEILKYDFHVTNSTRRTQNHIFIWLFHFARRPRMARVPGRFACLSRYNSIFFNLFFSSVSPPLLLVLLFHAATTTAKTMTLYSKTLLGWDWKAKRRPNSEIKFHNSFYQSNRILLCIQIKQQIK